MSKKKKQGKAAKGNGKGTKKPAKGAKKAAACPGGKKCEKPRHLCRIAKKGDLARVRRLVADAAFICGRCGRVANEKVNLCRPEKL